MNTVLILIAIASVGAASNALIQNRIKKAEKNVLDEVAIRSAKVTDRILEKIDERQADIKNVAYSISDEVKKEIVKNIIIPPRTNKEYILVPITKEGKICS